jgi:hypothetical protein
VIFDAEFARVRQKQGDLAAALEEMKSARARTANLLAEFGRCLEVFEQRVTETRRSREWLELPTYHAHTAGAGEGAFHLSDHRSIQRARNDWVNAIARLTRLRDRLDRKIKELEERKFRLEFWLLEKEETWGKLDPQKLKEQIREILQAAEELSQLVVGRKVPIVFDTREQAPLGYVPIRKEKNKGRRVYLSAAILGDQPQHLLDYYRALIVHELGHLLLHLKDSAQDYRRLRRLLGEKISLAPDFFAVFNILLDEQLERILRDTRPQWQGWFNRLDFYLRRIPLWDFKAILARSGRADADQAIEDLAARRLIKVYQDPKRPFVTIQSGALFSEGLGFARLNAFHAVFANKLPHATIAEPWLKECLDCIPKDFKSLDVFEMHTLAVKIYKILMQGSPGLSFVKVKVERGGSAGTIEIEMPGVDLRPSKKGAEKDFRVLLRSRSGSSSIDEQQTSTPSAPPPSSPEGDPPPVPPPQVRKQVFKRRPPRKKRVRSVRSTSRYAAVGPYIGTLIVPGWAVAAIAEEKSRRSAREKARQRKQARPAARRKPERSRPSKPSPPAQPPKAKATPPSAPAPIKPSGNVPDLENAERLAATDMASWSTKGAMKGLSKALDKLAEEIRRELASGRPKLPAIDKMVPDGGHPSDDRNETDVRQFPAPQGILQLLPNPHKNRVLTQSILRFVPVLRPYFAVLDSQKIWQEHLSGGRRLLGSGLTKHLAYGETRLFADLRQAEAEQHAEVFVGVLLDTSASMKTDGRLPRAVRAAALVAECLRECPYVESMFLGFNQNVYLCGTHDEHSLGSLEPAGKTNEAAALDYLRQHFLSMPRRRKVVLVLSDGLPTACSVESVRWLVRSLEKELGVRCLHGALSSTGHPAYQRRVDLTGEINAGLLRAFGRSVAALLR